MFANTHPVAVVTGGAGGIGAAICHGLATAGFQIVVGYNRSAAGAEQLATDLNGADRGLRHSALLPLKCSAIASSLLPFGSS